MKTRILFIVLISHSVFSIAQNKKWTLKECVDYALENNISIQKSKLDIESSKIDVQTSKLNFLPDLTAGAGHRWNLGLSTNPRTNQNVESTSTVQNSSFSLSSSVVLYDGLRNFRQLHRSNLNVLSKQYQLDDMKDNISLNVCNAFLQVLFNKESLKTLKAQYELSAKEVKRTKELVNAGSKPKGDILEIEATLADQEKAIVVMDNNILISKLNLFNLLVLEDFDQFDIADDDAYELIPTDIASNNPQDIYNKSLTIRNDIKLSEVAIEIAENEIKISKGAYQPSLSASYNLSASYTNLDTLDFKTQIDKNKGNSIGLSLNIPIFKRFQTRNAVKKSKLQLEQAKLDLQQSKFNLRDKVYQAFNDTKGALKTYEASQKALEARTLAYEYATEKFNLGAMDSFIFNQSKTRYVNAETDLIKAKYDYIFKLKVLEFYFGVPINL